MKVALSYSVPIQTEANFQLFRSAIERFCDRCFHFPLGYPCTIYAMCLDNDPSSEVKAMFGAMPVEFVRYDGKGFDGGAAQFLSKLIDPCFQISMGARCYFHRAGAVRAMVEAREKYGPGLYGSTCSKEIRLHVRPSFYGLDSTDFAEYPVLIDGHEKGTEFETGEQSLLNWSEGRGRPTYMVYWNGIFHEKADWFSQPNTFRRGDQSNLLAWDKRTDVYFSDPDPEKAKSAALVYGT